jgi:hypothetical protein
LKFRNKINTFLRLIIVGLLIYPFPIAVAVEQTETESFGDGVWTNSNFSATNYSSATYSIDTVYDGDYGCDGYCLNYNKGNQSNRMLQITFADTGITEIGFDVGAIDLAWHYNVFIKDANGTSSNPDWVTYNDTSSWNASTYVFEETYTAPTGYEIWRIEMNFSDYAIIDNFYYKYDDGITPTIGAPTNLATTQNLHSGAVGVTWTAPTGYTNTPERYAVAFSNDNFQTTNYAVATSTNSGDTSYTFSKSYLTSIFTDLEVGDTLYFKVRSDDDTNSLYSSWTDVVTYTIPDVASGVSTLTANQDNQYQGVTFYWTQPNTGWATQTSYKLAYKDSDDTEFTYVTGISADATNYTWTGVLEDTYEFLIYACTQNGSWCHGPQNGSITTTIVSTTPTTTIVYTLGPPINTEASNVYDSGVRVKWDAPDTGNATADTYELYYRTSPTDEVVVYNISNTEYTIPYANIPNGTYEFSVRAYDSVNNVYSDYSTEPTLTVFNQKAQDDADAAAAEAARKAEEERIAREKAEAERKERERLQELQNQRDKNLSETGYSETDAERSAREQKEYEEEQARLKAIEEEKNANYLDTGYYETNQERSDREQKEYEEEQARLAELERQRSKNEAETGYYETDAERSERERLEIQEAAEKALLAATTSYDDDKVLTDKEEKEIEELVDAIIDIKNNVDFKEYDVEEDVFEIPDVIELPKDEIQILDDEIDDAEEILDGSEEVTSEGDLAQDGTEEAIEEEITSIEETIIEVMEVIEIPEDDSENAPKIDVNKLSEEQKEVVNQSVTKVTTTEDVVNMSEEEKTVAAAALGVQEEELEVVAELSENDESVAKAVDEFVERASEVPEGNEYTLADAITEVQVEAFLENPLKELTDINIEEFAENLADVSEIGNDMTTDQKEKAQEVVVPVIIASQIIAQAGSILRRF